jgi:hypothetical protein
LTQSGPPATSAFAPSMNANLTHKKLINSDFFARLAMIFSRRLLNLYPSRSDTRWR